MKEKIYNRLELVLLSKYIDLLDFQPLLDEYGIYAYSHNDFISYGKEPSSKTKKEIVQRIVNKEIQIEKLDEYSQEHQDGYFNFYDMAYDQKLAPFSFIHININEEHKLIKEFDKLDSTDYVYAQFGVLEDGRIIEKEKVGEFLEAIKFIENSQLLDKVCGYYKKEQNFFSDIQVSMWVHGEFGRISTKEAIDTKYQELKETHEGKLLYLIALDVGYEYMLKENGLWKSNSQGDIEC